MKETWYWKHPLNSQNTIKKHMPHGGASKEAQGQASINH